MRGLYTIFRSRDTTLLNEVFRASESRVETRFFIKPDDVALISFELFAASTRSNFRSYRVAKQSARAVVGQGRRVQTPDRTATQVCN